MALKWLYFYEIAKLVQRQGVLPPDVFRDALSTCSSLFKTSNAGYCTNLGIEKF